MTRKEKIKALKAISEGKLTIEDLELPQVYFFLHFSNDPGIYEYNGRKYTQTEYREFSERVKRKNYRSIIWNEERNYEEDKIITLNFPDGD